MKVTVGKRYTLAGFWYKKKDEVEFANTDRYAKHRKHAVGCLG